MIYNDCTIHPGLAQGSYSWHFAYRCHLAIPNKLPGKIEEKPPPSHGKPSCLGIAAEDAAKIPWHRQVVPVLLPKSWELQSHWRLSNHTSVKSPNQGSLGSRPIGFPLMFFQESKIYWTTWKIGETYLEHMGKISSWWFQPSWKIWVKMGSSSPSSGENK